MKASREFKILNSLPSLAISFCESLSTLFVQQQFIYIKNILGNLQIVFHHHLVVSPFYDVISHPLYTDNSWTLKTITVCFLESQKATSGVPKKLKNLISLLGNIKDRKDELIRNIFPFVWNAKRASHKFLFCCHDSLFIPEKFHKKRGTRNDIHPSLRPDFHPQFDLSPFSYLFY